MKGKDNAGAAQPLAFYIAGTALALGGVSEELVRLEISRGNLKASRVGRRVVVPRAELLRYLEENAAAK